MAAGEVIPIADESVISSVADIFELPGKKSIDKLSWRHSQCKGLARRPLLDRIKLTVPLKKRLIHPNYQRVYS
jgi:hypothetical protein